MDLLVAKVLSALVLWILSLLFGLMIPYLIWRSRSGKRGSHCTGHEVLLETDALLSDGDSSANNAPAPSVWDHIKHLYKSVCRYDVLSAINCFCGGLFLGILLLELLPESQMGVQKVLDAANIHVNFPITEFMVASGLLVVMFIEHGVSATCGKKKPAESSYSVMRRNSSSSGLSGVVINCESAADSSSSDDINVVVTRRRRESLTSSESTRSLVLIAMLSIHSIFEGLALGLEVSVSPLIQLFVAVSVHKSVLAFGLGLRLFETLASTTIAMVCTLIFCTASPLGCAVGIIMTYDSEPLPNTTAAAATTTQAVTTTIALDNAANILNVPGTLIASAVLECLATGTFLYVTFIEVIPSEFAHASTGGHDHAEDLLAAGSPRTDTRGRHRKRHDNKVPIKKMYKLLILLLGFGTVTGLQFV